MDLIVVCLSYAAGWVFPYEDILADISAACTGIGRDFLLIETLGYREGLVRRKAVAFVGILLQGSKVVQEWWRCTAHLSCDQLHFKPALTAERSESGLCRCFILIVSTANGFQRQTLFFCENGEFPKRYGRKITIYNVPTANHSKCWGLYPSQRIASLTGNGQRTACIDTHEPVGFASCLGRMIEIVVMASWLEIRKSLTNSLVCK